MANFPLPTPHDVARARERFLSAGEEAEGAVRETILASWRRSRFWGVEVDRLEPPHQPDVDSDGPLMRAARPVLERLEREIADMPLSVILTDAHALVLHRRTGERSLNSHLDAVSLAPGFSYAEQFVGTNGIGTALEERKAAHVFGHEHFSERLQLLSCAGAPIRNLLTGRIEGVIDITCWRDDASPLMRVLVQEAARDIERRLLEQSSKRERILLQEFLARCRRTKKPVLCMGDNLIITNSSAAHLLDPNDHVILRETVAELLASRCRTDVQVNLSCGQTVKLRFHRVPGPTGTAGAVVEIDIMPRTSSFRTETESPDTWLPGLVGHSPAWTGVCQKVSAHCRTRTSLLLVGEPGVGKFALAQAAHRQFFPASCLSVFDAAACKADAPEEWLREVEAWVTGTDGTVVLRHLDRLDPVAMRRLGNALGRESKYRPWIVGTFTTDASAGLASAGLASAGADGLLRHFSAAVTVPPLRHRIADVWDLVPALLERHTRGREVGCAPEALRILLRCQWPGNVAQLDRALQFALSRRPAGGWIQPQDLPPECHVVSRRVLTPWESLERDAIVTALIEAGGNREKAAMSLGISRATIYRKINTYGIVLDAPQK